MAIGTYQQIVTLDETDGTGGVRALDPPTWYCAPLAEGGGLLTLVGHYHAGLTTAARVHFKGRTFHVDGVLDRGGRGFQTQITCKEVFDGADAVVPPAVVYADLVIADGASHYWRLDDPAGPTAVDLVGGANGTISGGVTLAQPGALTDGTAAMGFDGATGKIVTAVAVTIRTPVTVEAWVKLADTSQQPLVNTPYTGGQEQFQLFVTTGTQVANAYIINAAETLVTQVAGTHVVTTGFWHHIVFVLQSGTMAVYVDGTLDASAPTTFPLQGVTLRAELGYASLSASWLTGLLDEVAIYPHVLTAAQILAHYTAGTT